MKNQTYRLKQLFAFIFLLQLCFITARPAVLAREDSPDITKHPIYSTYTFQKDGKHIYFSFIPFAIEGIVCEVMQRDAILKKNLRAMGLEIVFYPFHKGLDSMFFVRRGDIDMGAAGAMQVLTSAATIDIEVTGIAKVTSASLITKKGIRDIRDLKGKRIASPEGTTGHIGLLTALSMAGIKETEVEFIPMNVGELDKALAEGRIDAFSAVEPAPSAALAKHKNFKVIHRFFLTGHLYQTSQFAQKHPAASIQLHASYVRSLRWLKKSEKNLKSAAQWTLQDIARFTPNKADMTIDQLMALARSDILRFDDLPQINESEFKEGGLLHKSFNFLKERGLLPPDSSWEKVMRSVNRQPINDVLANPKKYQLDEYEIE